MTREDVEQSADETIDLKEPGLAAFLAWLVPGLGHWYQGRTAKAILYFVCIMGLFGYGVYLSSSNEKCRDSTGTIGYGRAVYFSCATATGGCPTSVKSGPGCRACRR